MVTGKKYRYIILIACDVLDHMHDICSNWYAYSLQLVEVKWGHLVILVLLFIWNTKSRFLLAPDAYASSYTDNVIDKYYYIYTIICMSG